MQWIPFAMVRVTTLFIAGVVTAIYLPALFSTRSASVLLLVFLTFYFLSRFLFLTSDWLSEVTGVVGLLAVFFAGYLDVLIRNESRRDDHIIQYTKTIQCYQIKLISAVEEKEKSFKRTGSIIKIKTESGWQDASGNINLYWPKTETVNSLDYGDVLLVKGQPRELEHPYNPHEFNFKEHLRFKNIYHQHYVKAREWKLLHPSVDKGFLFYSHRARNWSVAAIKRNVLSPREQGIVIALVLGVTDGLDNELLNAYSASGTLHVLAVSGLHVSIIYGLILLLLKPLGKSPTAEWFIAIISLILLWSYGFITGLSPSVLRAVVMFTFVVLAKPIGRHTNIYNTLAASAFCLLLYDPYLLMSVGFQLSYLAVLGIVYLSRPIYHLWETKSWLLNWAWELSSVSIAAQIATFALGFFYFHQFPVYFLISNLAVIPASFVVLIGGILLLIISPFEVIASWLGWALDWFVKLLNEVVFLVERMPGSVINDVYISASQCFLLFFVLILVLLFIRYKKFYRMILITFLIMIFSFISWAHLFSTIHASRWVVYHVKGHSVMEWTKDGSSVFLSDSSFIKDRKQIKFHLQPNRLVNGISDLKTVSFSSSMNGFHLYRQANKTFMVIQSPNMKLPRHINVDYLVVSNNSVRSIRKLKKQVEFDQLILDSSNAGWYCDRMEKELSELNLKYYSVVMNGAFQVDL